MYSQRIHVVEHFVVVVGVVVVVVVIVMLIFQYTQPSQRKVMAADSP